MLIINTHIKNARSVAEKDQEVPNEQIRHAVILKILVLRTIDLLGLLKIFLSGKVKVQEVKDLLTQNSGWLRVSEGNFEVVNGHAPEDNI